MGLLDVAAAGALLGPTLRLLAFREDFPLLGLATAAENVALPTGRLPSQRTREISLLG